MMKSRPPKHLFGLALIAAALIFAGCDDSAGQTDDVSMDVGMDIGADTSGVVCLSSTGCNAEPGAEGQLCIDSLCTDCVSDSECQADPNYGDTAGCVAGRCEVCPDGNEGCACFADDTCTAGSCIAGTCIDCTQGAVDCLCNDDGSCTVGGRCNDGTGLCETCPDGEENCPCGPGEFCGTGLECLMSQCAPESCNPGELDCPCDTGDTCNAGLGCDAGSVCQTCDADYIDCDCNLTDGCSNDLICDDPGLVCRAELTCGDVTCVTNQLCDELSDGEDAICVDMCAAGFTWNAMTGMCDAVTTSNCDMNDPDSILDQCTMQNQACDDTGMGASCGACLSGYIDDGMSNCRIMLTCTDIQASCDAQNRDCDAGDGTTTEATCGACTAPYVDVNGNCELSTNANCTVGDPDSIVTMCETANRECELITGGGAQCGACVSGYGENVNNANACELLVSCVDAGCAGLGRECLNEPFATCGDCFPGSAPVDPNDDMSQCRTALTCADITCTDPEVCIEGESGNDATCVSSQCQSGEAFNQQAGTCDTCGSVCGSTPGETGNHWIYTQVGGGCICETEDGYYLDTSAAFLPRLCDADNDGWVVQGAEAFINSTDPAIAANARCSPRLIDRVTLINEFDQSYEVLLCLEGLVAADTGACMDVDPVTLYEPAALDDPVELASVGSGFPDYVDSNGAGRVANVDELNPLTKSCILNADYNYNGLADIQEAHEMSIPAAVQAGLTTTQAKLFDFNFFTELHRSWYEDRPPNDYGTLIIQERSRCDDGLGGENPFTYGYNDLSGSTYWRECSRNRDAAFDRNNITTGFDFARWSCDGTPTGSCAQIAPPTLEAGLTDIPLHGMCEVALPPADGVWRGMNHHSQFKCVEVENTATDEWDMAVADLYDPVDSLVGTYTFNDCGITSSEVSAGNPSIPILTCVNDVPDPGTVGFVSARYLDGTNYQRGCMDEQVWTGQLCPGSVVTSDGQANDFGNLACGCGQNYGGIACDEGCPNVAVSPTYSVAPRLGYWLCGGITQTAMTGSNQSSAGPVFTNTNASGTWSVRGKIATTPVDRQPMCEGGTCGTGYALY